MQGRNTDIDVENGHGLGESGTNWEVRTDMHTLLCIKQLVGSCRIVQGAQLGAL